MSALARAGICSAHGTGKLYSEPPESHSNENIEIPTSSIRKPIPADPRVARIEILRLCIICFDLTVLSATSIVLVATSHYPSATVLPLMLATVVTAQLIGLSGQYGSRHLSNLRRQSGIVICAASLWLLIALGAALTVPPGVRASPAAMLVGAGFAAVVMMTIRAYARWQVLRWVAAGALRRRVAIIGANQVSLELIRRVRSDPADAVRITGVYDACDERAPVTHGGIVVRGGLPELIGNVQSGDVDLVVIALPSDRQDLLREIKTRLAICACDVGTFSEPAAAYTPRAILEPLGETLSVVVTQRPLAGKHAACKALFDVAAAAILLLVLAPAFCLIILAIRLDSPGPIFFRQQRFGLNQRLFNILKFRTMRHEMADLLADRQTSVDDDRVTRVGRWLRRTSLDELPQLINVITRDMSLVGPRPHAPGTRAGTRPLDHVTQDYRLRHQVKPGMTGLAQVNGCRGAISNEDQLLRRTEYDLSYINQWSFGLDLKILLLTLIRGFIAKNAY